MTKRYKTDMSKEMVILQYFNAAPLVAAMLPGEVSTGITAVLHGPAAAPLWRGAIPSR